MAAGAGTAGGEVGLMVKTVTVYCVETRIPGRAWIQWQYVAAESGAQAYAQQTVKGLRKSRNSRWRYRTKKVGELPVPEDASR